VTKHYATDFANLGGQIIYNFKVKSFEECKHNRAIKIISKKNVTLSVGTFVSIGIYYYINVMRSISLYSS